MTGGIQEIDMSRAMNSQSYAHSIWLNYYKYDNTCGANSGQIGQIEQRWNYMINAWYASYESDSNEYEVTEDEYNQWVSDGEDYAHELSGYDNTTWDRTLQYGSVAVDAVWAAGSQYAGQVVVSQIAQNAAVKAAEESISGAIAQGALQESEAAIAREAAIAGAKAAGKEAASAVAKEETAQIVEGTVGQTAVGQFFGLDDVGVDNASDAIGNAATNAADNVISNSGVTHEVVLESVGESGSETIVADGLSEGGEQAVETATGEGAQAAEEAATEWGVFIALACDLLGLGKYLITNPNKTEYEAVRTLANGMAAQQENTTSAAMEMVNADCMALESVDNATTANEEANSMILDQSAEYKVYEEAYGYMLKDKTRGVVFDDEAVKQMDEYVECMTELSEGVDDTVAEAEMTVQDLHDEVESSISTYDAGAEAYCNTRGYTDETAKIDTSTRLSCNIEGGVQTVASGKAVWHSIKAFAEASASSWCGIGIAYAVAGAAELGVAASDAYFASEQFGMASDIKQEEGVRAQTEQMNEFTAQQYDTSIQQYQVNLEDMEALSLEVPDGIEAPESEGAAAGGGAALAAGPTSGGGALTGGGNGEDENKEPFDPYSFLIG